VSRAWVVVIGPTVERTLFVSLYGKVRLVEPSQADETRPAFGGTPAQTMGPWVATAAYALRAVRARRALEREQLEVQLADAEGWEDHRRANALREKLARRWT
jgi:hypothetical protein